MMSKLQSKTSNARSEMAAPAEGDCGARERERAGVTGKTARKQARVQTVGSCSSHVEGVTLGCIFLLY